MLDHKFDLEASEKHAASIFRVNSNQLMSLYGEMPHVKLFLERAMKAQRGSRGIALFFL